MIRFVNIHYSDEQLLSDMDTIKSFLGSSCKEKIVYAVLSESAWQKFLNVINTLLLEFQ
jgi:hypothetical protein